jgi:hypothetical protein
MALGKREIFENRVVGELLIQGKYLGKKEM